MASGKNRSSPDLPPSRGVPADETMWFPSHYGREIRSKGGLDSKIRWDLKEVIDFIFPKRYQPTYHQVAVDFVSLVLEKGRLSKEDISKFLKENDHSRSTLENKIIPKLSRAGIIKREREATGKMKKKGRGLVISESLTYSNYLKKIAEEWETLVATSRHKRKIEEEEGGK